MANILPSSVEQNNPPIFSGDCALKSVMQHEVTFDGSLIIICSQDKQTFYFTQLVSGVTIRIL